MTNIRLLGIGNILWTDEGFGVCCVEVSGTVCRRSVHAPGKAGNAAGSAAFCYGNARFLAGEMER